MEAEGQKVLGSGHGYQQTDSYTNVRYDQLVRDLGMKDSSSFFNYMTMKPLMFDVILDRVGMESKRLTPTSGKRLN